MKKVIGLMLIVGLCAMGMSLMFTPTEIQSHRELLHTTYERYKQYHISPEGRVVRPSDFGDTVSEGQAYALLVAVWMDDQATFDLCYGWTEAHLSRQQQHGDHLLAWRWVGGAVADWAPASDADEDYAYALLLAHEKWGAPSSPLLTGYLEKAREVTSDILRKETVATSDHKLVLLPGTWGSTSQGIIWNPSYFSPAWYRKFYQHFGDSRWLELTSSGYYFLQKVSERLGNTPGVGLVPDWCLITPNGELTESFGQSSDYSWDAFRIGWRVYMDWKNNRSQDAYAFLSKLHSFYQKEWHAYQNVVTAYTYSGQRRSSASHGAISYVAMLASGLAVDPKGATAAANNILQYVQENDSPLYYYGNSWALLALLLITNLEPDK